MPELQGAQGSWHCNLLLFLFSQQPCKEGLAYREWLAHGNPVCFMSDWEFDHRCPWSLSSTWTMTAHWVFLRSLEGLIESTLKLCLHEQGRIPKVMGPLQKWNQIIANSRMRGDIWIKRMSESSLFDNKQQNYKGGGGEKGHLAWATSSRGPSIETAVQWPISAYHEHWFWPCTISSMSFSKKETYCQPITEVAASPSCR